MTDTLAAPSAPGRPWTCPFCSLACDHLGVTHAGVTTGGASDASTGAGSASLALTGGECERASRALAQFSAAPSNATPLLDGQPCDLDSAVAAAAKLLGASRQPLFGGLGTDVAGARALYPLACATGAICDAGAGDALMLGLRALQDRGQYTTTFAEVRTRADLIVFIGGLPTEVAPLIGQRCGIGEPFELDGGDVPHRHVIALGPREDDDRTLFEWRTLGGMSKRLIALHGDLFDTMALLSRFSLALADKRPLPDAPLMIRALANRLRNAHYAVLIGSASLLPARGGALIVEAVNQIVGALNRDKRAASLWIDGGDGAATVNQVFTWLSGLPLRSRASPGGLEHEPLLFDGARLLADGAVDSLLWVSSFTGDSPPPNNDLPMVVVGHPALGASLRGRGALPTVFIPTSTPGIGSAGHVFRTDGVGAMPLFALRDERLPTVADVLGRIHRALPAAATANAPAAMATAPRATGAAA